jgi:class 3 adenylate cyclase
LFFSDIKGFTGIADQVEAEDLSRVLNEYLAEMTEIAERYDTTVDKFIGDAIMIFFGAPMATDDHDHALRATRMAVDMQERMLGLREKWLREGIEEPSEIRIGINTGVASVGNFGARGRMDYTAIGRQVTLASRLQVNCAPGKILLSHSTWVLVNDEIACEPKGEILVKGIHYPVKVYEGTMPIAAERAAV